MQAVTVPPLSLSLDPKRIAATGLAITVHLAALMLLMLPAVTAPPVIHEEIPMTVIPVLIPPRPPPPPELRVRDTPVPTAPRPVAEAVVAVDTTVSPVAVYTPVEAVVEPLQPVQEVVAVAAFAQIRADISPPPPYPTQALKRRQSGVVMLRVRVDAQGRPLDAQVAQSSGFRLLDTAALKFVVARWHFIPATRDGLPIEAVALVPISFVIE